MTKSLRPYQTLMIDWIIRHPKCALFAFMGAGKTVSIQIGDELTGGARVAQEDAGGPAFSVPKDTLALLQDAIDGKAKPKALPESPDAEEGAGGGLPPGMDIEELLRQAGAGGQ